MVDRMSFAEAKEAGRVAYEKRQDAQTFGDFLGFNPHCHILVTDGCFYGKKGIFRVAPPLELKQLKAITIYRKDS